MGRPSWCKVLLAKLSNQSRPRHWPRPRITADCVITFFTVGSEWCTTGMLRSRNLDSNNNTVNIESSVWMGRNGAHLYARVICDTCRQATDTKLWTLQALIARAWLVLEKMNCSLYLQWWIHGERGIHLSGSEGLFSENDFVEILSNCIGRGGCIFSHGQLSGDSSCSLFSP